MDVIMIEETALKIVTECLGQLAGKIDELHQRYADKRMKQYLDNQDVCLRLHVSKRTLQNYRNAGKIPFTRIEKKIYYHSRDIENYLNKNRQKR